MQSSSASGARMRPALNAQRSHVPRPHVSALAGRGSAREMQSSSSAWCRSTVARVSGARMRRATRAVPSGEKAAPMREPDPRSDGRGSRPSTSVASPLCWGEGRHAVISQVPRPANLRAKISFF